jgi:hypothetical protein
MPILDVPSFTQPRDEALLWRYVDLAEYVTILRTQKFRFARLDSFPDRWEGVSRAVTARDLRSGNAGPIVGRHTYVKTDLDTPERKHASVLCWCHSEFENATFWQRYSPTNLGIALKTRVGRFKKLLAASTHDVVFGNVGYVDIRGMSPTPNDVPRRFFLKDRSYAAESEVVYRPGVDAPVDGELFDAPIMTRGFVADVVLHPSAPDWFGRLVRDIMGDYKHVAWEIQKSDLGGEVSAHTLEL